LQSPEIHVGAAQALGERAGDRLPDQSGLPMLSE
jgi:hypothetical protein